MNLFKRCHCPDSRACDHPYWYKFILHGRRYRGSTETANERKADLIAGRQRTDVLDGKAALSKPKPIPLATHIEEYCAHTAKANRTAYKDRPALDRLQEVIGNRDLDEIRPFDLERWKVERAKDVSKSTVNRELIILRGCFSRAVEWGRLRVSPAKGVKPYKVDDQRVRVLSDEELKTVLAIADPFVTLLCRATLESLGRLSEILNLQKSHIGPSWIEVRRKGGAVDRVPVTPELRTTLLERCHAGSGAVFGEGEAGRVVTQQVATNRVLRALEAAGVRSASHHTMRHTGVTLMLEHGVNPRVIQRLAGWSSLRMLERYGHPRDAEAVRAVVSVSSYLDAATKTATEPDQSDSTAQS